MQSLMMIISTAGKDAENNPCKREYDDVCKMMRSEIPMDEEYFVMVREIEKDDDPHDESVWPKANPILQEENEYSEELLRQIRIEHNAAYNTGNPAKIREFLTKRVNRWQSDSENKYMSGIMDKWKALAVSKEEFQKLVKGRKNHTGLDLSKTTRNNFV